MLDDQIKVSVIVPIYNVENYLEKCLSTILCQTESKIEVICVEDCSKDSSFKLLKKIAKKDSRIKIIQNQMNQGLSYTRNRGLDMAVGKYVMFVDSDDYLPDYAVANMYQMAVCEDLELIFGDVRIMSELADTSTIEQPRIRKNTYRNAQGMYLFEQLVQHHEMFGTAWGILYKTSFLKKHGLRFRNNVYHEDIAFIFQAILLSEYAGCIDKVCYYYLRREKSITTGNEVEKRLEGVIAAFCDMIAFWLSHTNSFNVISESIRSFIQLYYLNMKAMFHQLDGTLIKSPIISYVKQIGLFSENIDEIAIKNTDMEVIRDSPMVAIYGAGCVARKTLRYLNSHNIRVDVFIVSNKEDNPKEIDGIPVFGKEFLEGLQKDMAVIIGVSRRYKDEVENQMPRGEKIKLFLIQEL